MTQAAAAISRHSSCVPPRQAVSTSRDARGSVLGGSWAVPEPATIKFVFAGWLGGRQRIACESRADGSPAHGRAFWICGRSRAPDRRGEKLAKTLSDWQQCQRGAAVSSSLAAGRARLGLGAPTDHPRPQRACRAYARSPVTGALRVPLWEEVQGARQ